MSSWSTPLADRVLAAEPQQARFVEADRRELTLIAKVDAVEVFHGRRQIHAFHISHRVAVKVAVFLLRWWIFSCWFGLRQRLWFWALRVKVKHVDHPQVSHSMGSAPERPGPVRGANRLRPTPARRTAGSN